MFPSISSADSFSTIPFKRVRTTINGHKVGREGESKSKKQYLFRFYEDWNKDIISTVPSENLLVFDVRSGWGPLCEFLDCPEPSVPFPR